MKQLKHYKDIEKVSPIYFGCEYYDKVSLEDGAGKDKYIYIGIKKRKTVNYYRMLCILNFILNNFEYWFSDRISYKYDYAYDLYYLKAIYLKWTKINKGYFRDLKDQKPYDYDNYAYEILSYLVHRHSSYEKSSEEID